MTIEFTPENITLLTVALVLGATQVYLSLTNDRRQQKAKNKKMITCPKCGVQGQVGCLKDALAVIIIGQDKKDSYLDDTIVYDDAVDYKCYACDRNLKYDEIKHLTNW